MQQNIKILLIFIAAIITTTAGFSIARQEPNETYLNLVPPKEGFEIESYIVAVVTRDFDPNMLIGINFNVNEQIKNADPQKLLALLANYDKETSQVTSQFALSFDVKIANLHPAPEIRQEVTRRLVSAVIDPNSNVEREACKFLGGFTKEDFNANTREMLHNALARNDPDERVIRICGVADMKEELPRLKELLIDEIEYINNPMQFIPFYYTAGWEARLARARIGVKEDIAKCIELAELMEDPNERVLRVLPYIGHIRQPEAIEYLKKYLDSDGHFPPTTPNASFGESYSHWVMDILTKCLKNFPVEQKLTRGYTKEDIELCRKWMSEQKEWQIKR